MTFGELVREVRVDLLLTQTQFADRLGVNRVTVGRWEAGVQMPSLAARRELRRKFRLELENKPKRVVKRQMTDRQTLVLMFERADFTVEERGTDLVLPAWHEAMPDAQDITITFDEKGALVSMYAWESYR